MLPLQDKPHQADTMKGISRILWNCISECACLEAAARIPASVSHLFVLNLQMYRAHIKLANLINDQDTLKLHFFRCLYSVFLSVRV